jgi:hypothetical protein
MKSLLSRGIFLGAVGMLTVAVGALAQSVSDPESFKARAPFAHLVVSSRAIAFGLVKEIETKSIKIRNSGNLNADITVTPPSQPSPFSVTSTQGPFALEPGQVAEVTVQFAPTAAGRVTGAMAIQCGNCNTSADDLIGIRLSGNARTALASPTSIVPTATPTGSGTVPTPTPTPGGATSNALPFSVNGGAFQEADAAFASINVCVTGTSNCTTVNNMLIDTGSTGIRIFGSQLQGLGIAPNSGNGGAVGECAFFGSGSTWGAVSTVDLQMAGEPTVTVPIQVLDDINAFAPAPHDCTEGSELMSSPSETGFNGLLGVGQDTTDEPNIFTEYFTCSGNSCGVNENPSASDVVSNPVAQLPVDNNGVVVSLPAIAAGGAGTVSGTLYFGIGTQSDNQPGAVKVFQAEADSNNQNFLNINTTFEGQTAGSFFDTGSNGLFFNSNSITQCSSEELDGFYCPASTASESATNLSVGTSTTGSVSFSVADAQKLFNTNDNAFDDLGGTFDGGTTFDGFDWGLPFFFGRQVYFGISNASSPLGTGPYTAY